MDAWRSRPERVDGWGWFGHAELRDRERDSEPQRPHDYVLLPVWDYHVLWLDDREPGGWIRRHHSEHLGESQWSDRRGGVSLPSLCHQCLGDRARRRPDLHHVPG